MLGNDDLVLYFHINPLKNHVFYVGIGNEKRPYYKYKRGTWWNRTVNKYGYIIDIVHTNLTREKACELEKFYIKFIGRRDQNKGTLINKTDGGEGSSGHIVSQERRDYARSILTGRKRSPEISAKISQTRKLKQIPKKSRLDIELMYKLREQGYSQYDIASVLGTHQATISKYLKKFKESEVSRAN